MTVEYSYKVTLGKIKPWSASSATSAEVPLSANNVTETLSPRRLLLIFTRPQASSQAPEGCIFRAGS